MDVNEERKEQKGGRKQRKDTRLQEKKENFKIEIEC
jgi:hypothetical protein